MDFDDLDDVEATAGPQGLQEQREKLQTASWEELAAAAPFPRPKGRGFGGAKRLQKVLYLHGPGSNKLMAEKQVQAVFKNLKWVVDFELLEWHFVEGAINYKLEEIHWDPAVQKIFAPFGRPCGESYDGYMSYFSMWNESHQDETWLGPEASKMAAEGLGACGSNGYEDVLEHMAAHLAENGPYDGVCGFDMGASLAFDMARLAQEGDKRFTEKFRYLVLFSARGHRARAQLSQGSLRPKAPLQIPCFMSWSREDDSKQYSNYEELALYVHPNFRRICVHGQGHRPPNLKKGTQECELLDAFIGEMQADTFSGVQEDGPDIYKDFWLPLPREPAALPEPPMKVIVVVDPLGEHGPTAAEAKADRSRFPAQEPLEVCQKRLSIFRQVTATKCEDLPLEGWEVLSAAFQPSHVSLRWHPEIQARDSSVAYSVDAGRSRWLQAEDEVALPWSKLAEVAEQLLESLEVGRDSVALVGLGTGGIVAFALALALVRRGVLPAKLCCACPPTVWPEGAPGPGSLVTTPVSYLTCAESVAGPPWRFETSTFGPFAQRHFEDKATMVATISEEINALR
ncbi:unnamed protein product [Effrenium voratum]|nr:unnamed protein product [Effrenium voratum]